MAMQLLVFEKARTHVYVYAVDREVMAFISTLVYDLPCMGFPFLWHKERAARLKLCAYQQA
jgi:hypothetical protein